jgi:hypothetical protein
VVRLDALERVEAEPLRGEVVDERGGFVVGEHAADLAIVKLSARGGVEELVVRMLLHRRTKGGKRVRSL